MHSVNIAYNLWMMKFYDKVPPFGDGFTLDNKSELSRRDLIINGWMRLRKSVNSRIPKRLGLTWLEPTKNGEQWWKLIDLFQLQKSKKVFFGEGISWVRFYLMCLQNIYQINFSGSLFNMKIINKTVCDSFKISSTFKANLVNCINRFYNKNHCW